MLAYNIAPPKSLHLLLWRWCSQMLVPPRSSQLLIWRLCSQMLVPPQSLRSLLTRLWANAPRWRDQCAREAHRRVRTLRSERSPALCGGPSQSAPTSSWWWW